MGAFLVGLLVTDLLVTEETSFRGAPSGAKQETRGAPKLRIPGSRATLAPPNDDRAPCYSPASYFFSAALSSPSIAAASPPAFFTASAQDWFSGCVAFFHSASCSGVSG